MIKGREAAAGVLANLFELPEPDSPHCIWPTVCEGSGVLRPAEPNGSDRSDEDGRCDR
jgi:hypothetical protein